MEDRDGAASARRLKHILLAPLTVAKHEPSSFPSSTAVDRPCGSQMRRRREKKEETAAACCGVGGSGAKDESFGGKQVRVALFFYARLAGNQLGETRKTQRKLHFVVLCVKRASLAGQMERRSVPSFPLL